MTLRNRVRGILKSDFNRHFLVLFSGSSISQLIPILANVILARIYSPEEFGVLAIFTALISTFTGINNLRYEFAIPLPKEDKDAVVITFLAMFAAVVFSSILLLIAFIFKTPILKLVGGEKLGNWLYFVPVAIFILGINSPLNYFALRFKKYKTIASSNVFRSSSAAGLQLGFGFAGLTQSGLIIGTLLSYLAGNAAMTKFFLKFKHLFKHANKAELKRNAIRYKKFPLLSMWGIFLNNLSVNINNFFVSRVYGLGELGLFSYSYRYLSIPLALIGNTMGQLFFQVSSDCYKNDTPATEAFLSTLKKLVVIALPVFALLFFTIEDISAFVFGEQWRIAGYYAKLLLPLYFIRTIYIPLSPITNAFEKLELALKIHVAIFSGNILSFIIAYFAGFSIKNFLITYCIIGSIIYTLMGYILFLVASKRIK